MGKAFVKGTKLGSTFVFLMVVWGVVDYLTRREDFVFKGR